MSIQHPVEHHHPETPNIVQPTPDRGIIPPGGYKDAPAPTKPARIPDAEIIANSVFKDPITITRNGIDATLPVFVGSRKQWDGVPYIAFQVKFDESKPLEEDSLFLNSLKWLDRANVTNALNAFLRRFGQDAYKDNTPESGENAGILNLAGLIKDWTEMAASGLNLADLKALLDTEQKAYQEFISNVAMVKLMDPNTTLDEKLSIKKQSEAMIDSVKRLRDQWENRKRKPSAEEQVTEVRPV